MQLKIISLNLWNGGRLLDQAVAFLQEQQPDLLFLQEAYDGRDEQLEARFRTSQVLQAAFPEYHVDFAGMYLDTRLREGDIEDGQFLLSRWPLTNPHSHFFDVPYGAYDQDAMTDFSDFPAGVQEVTTRVADHEIVLLNVHGPVNYDGLADTDRRLRMREVLLERVAAAGERPVILAGDFNVQPATQTMRDLAQALTPVFPEGELATTFNMRRKTNPGFATAAVDQILVSHHFQVLEKTCPDVDISDHLPLLATLEL